MKSSKIQKEKSEISFLCTAKTEPRPFSDISTEEQNRVGAFYAAIRRADFRKWDLCRLKPHDIHPLPQLY